MCIPHQNMVPQPAAVSSTPAATNLQIGGAGAPRGAAQLGRLALRFGGAASGASTQSTASAQQTAATLGAAPVVASNPAANPAANEAQQPGVGTTPGSLAGFRFGNFNGAFA